MPPGVHQPSLQQLQALEQNHAGFDAQVRALGEILELDVSVSRAHTDYSSRCKSGNGRLDRGLRWLLSKLQASGSAGTEARRTTEAWILLGNILAVLHPFHIARALSSNNLLPTFAFALSENFEINKNTTTAHDLNGQHNVNGETKEAGDSVNETNPQNKKRKRSKQDESSTTVHKRRAIDTTNAEYQADGTKAELFSALYVCLSNLITIAQSSSLIIDPFCLEHIRSSLILNTKDAASLLGAWITAVTWCNECPKSCNSASKQCDQRDLISLSNAIYIWDQRSTTSSNSVQEQAVRKQMALPECDANYYNYSQTHFAEACLVPSIRFLCQIKRLHGSKEIEDVLLNLILTQAAAVERLLAKYMFLPAKSVFQGGPERKSTHSSSAAEDKNFIEDLIRPLREADSSGLTDAVTLMFDIAVRCSPTASARRKPAESAWLQSVVTALIPCLNIKLNGLSSSEPAVGDYEQFGRLLNMTQRAKITLTKELVTTIASQVSGLQDSDTANVRWSIVTQLLALQPDIFVKTRSEDQQQAGDKSQTLDEQLVRAVTAQAWTTPDSTKQDGSGLYASIKEEILLPLIKAYIAARDLLGFLRLWQAQLILVFRNSRHESHGSVWKDPELRVIIGRNLGASSTPRQFLDVFTTLADKLSNESTDISDTSEAASIASTACILSAILHGLSDEVLEKQIYARVVKLLSQLGESLAQSKLSNTGLRTQIWRLAEECHQFIFETAEPEAVQELSSMSIWLFQQATLCLRVVGESKTSQLHTLGAAALSCAGSIISDFSSRNLDLTALPRTELMSVISAWPRGGLPGNDQSLWANTFIDNLPLLAAPTPPNTDPDLVYTSFIYRVVDILVTASTSGTASFNFWHALCAQAIQKQGPPVATLLYAALQVRKINSRDPFIEQITTCVETGYLEIPSSLIPQSLRKTIIQQIFALHEHQPDQSGWCRRLSLLLWLLDGTPSAELFLEVTDDDEDDEDADHPRSSGDIWKFASAFDSDITAGNIDTQATLDMSMLMVKVIKKILLHDCRRLKGDRRKGLFQSIRDTVLKRIDDSATFSQSPAALTLCSIVCSQEIRTKFSTVDDLQIEEKILGRLYKILVMTFEDLVYVVSKGSNDSAIPVAAVYASLRAITELRASDQDTTPSGCGLLLEQLRVAMQSHVSSSTGADYDSCATLLALTYQTQYRIRAVDSESVIVAESQRALSEMSSSVGRYMVYDTFTAAVEAADENEKHKLLQDVIPTVSTTANTTQNLQLLAAVVQSTTKKSHAALLPPSSVSELTTSLAAQLPLATSPAAFLSAATTIAHLLRHHSKAQSQLSIDTTLQSIITICSPAGPTLPISAAPRIFTKLTRILHHLLTHHRRALRGRSDLLILSLQSLLRSLFHPAPSTSGGSGTAPGGCRSLQHPPWSPSRPSTALGPKATEAYSRLLTTLCDPTYASVRTAHSRHTNSHGANANLIDATKSARTYASQYVPLILLELCRCMLVGRLGEGAREKLLPGIWAIFEICGREVLEAVSEGVGVGGGERSVLRALREEWRRVGGGRGAGKR